MARTKDSRYTVLYAVAQCATCASATSGSRALRDGAPDPKARVSFAVGATRASDMLVTRVDAGTGSADRKRDAGVVDTAVELLLEASVLSPPLNDAAHAMPDCAPASAGVTQPANPAAMTTANAIAGKHRDDSGHARDPSCSPLYNPIGCEAARTAATVSMGTSVPSIQSR